MFELVVLVLGVLISVVLAGLKMTEHLSIGWIGVMVPFGISVLIVLLKHGVDVTDFIPD